MPIHIQYRKTKIGELIIGSFQEKICILDFRYRKMRVTVDHRIKNGLREDFIEKEDPVIRETYKQVDQYLQGVRRSFNLPIQTVGTHFQKQVWLELMKIPYGETISYLDLAKKVNNPKAVRAVASANGANAIALIIPCHRVIESNGGVGGYGGGIPVKKMLLNMESSLP